MLFLIQAQVVKTRIVRKWPSSKPPTKSSTSVGLPTFYLEAFDIQEAERMLKNMLDALQLQDTEVHYRMTDDEYRGSYRAGRY